MILLTADDIQVSVTLMPDELLIACNALNEVLNGLRIADFAATLGVNEATARKLHHSLLAVLDAQAAGQRP